MRLPIVASILCATLLVVESIHLGNGPREADKQISLQPMKPADPLDTRFRRGVRLLHTRSFEAAARAFSEIAALAPWMPEAEVNLAYALMGMGRYDEAQRHFDRALDLNGGQLNAYYGLAITREQQGDLDSALGAMRVYVHLAESGDPYLRKAWAAVWEWENAREAKRKVIE